MSIRSLVPGYIPLMQKPACCAVTCLQMILFRNQVGLFDQEELAIKFGVKVPAEDILAFRTEMSVMTSANVDEGIHTVESEEQISCFLEKMAPELRATSFKHSRIGSLSGFLSSHLDANRDIWVEYHAHEIHSTDDQQGKYIHDGLIESINLADGSVILIDPMPKHRQRQVISLEILDHAISTRFGHETGFVVIDRENRLEVS